jgi:hypothetical protein
MVTIKNSEGSATQKWLLGSIVIGLLLVCSQFLTLKKQNKSFSIRLQNQKNYQTDGMKFLFNNMTSLRTGQFDQGFLYQLNPDNNSLKLLSSHLNVEKSFNYNGRGNLLSSFVLKSRVDNYEVNYISVCVPRTKALSMNGVSFQSLLQSDLWPFMTESQGKVEVHCCPRNQPTCRENNVINQNTNYIVQMFRYDPNMSVIRPILTRAEFGSVSSAGFFIFANKHFKNKIHAKFFTFFNECLSQKIIFVKSGPRCSQKISFKSGDITAALENNDPLNGNFLSDASVMTPGE